MKPQIGGPGEAMIVCATREICVRLYDALAERRKHWASDKVDEGVMKIVIHGERTDPEHLRKHALRKSQQKTVQARAEDPDDSLELHRPLDAAHRVRRAAYSHPSHGPSHAGREPDAGPGPRQPSLPR
nr:hypothetical protein [Streptomyces glaucescens]